MKARAIPILVVAALAFARSASASSALEYPDNGVAQFSRGGAWLATATDPIAGFYNPAALAWQPTGLGIGMNLAFQTICYQRKGPGGSDVGPNALLTAQGATYPEVCNSNAGKPNLIPNVAFAWRVTERLGAALTIVPPSSYGVVRWPDLVSVEQRSEPIPAPQRYLSLYTKGTILFPTLSAGYAITDQLAVGAGFVAGIALLEFQSMSMANVQQPPVGQQATDDFIQDTRSQLKVKDLFVPGFVASVLYRLDENIDLAAWGRYSDKIRAKGDLEVVAPFYTAGGIRRTVCESPGQTNCAETTKSEDQVGKDGAKVTLTIPAEVRIGARFHEPRGPAAPLEAERLRADPMPTRDPLRDDAWDIELNLTYANNASADRVKIRFPDDIAVNGTPGFVPKNADRPTGWKDSYGARLGGQYNLIRNLFGVRAGTWVETGAVKKEYLTVTGVPAFRGGFGGGMVFRIQRVDVEAGYQHIWNAGLDNGGDGSQHAIAGTGSPDNRSYHAVNGGSVSQHANVLSFGGVARF